MSATDRTTADIDPAALLALAAGCEHADAELALSARVQRGIPAAKDRMGGDESLMSEREHDDIEAVFRAARLGVRLIAAVPALVARLQAAEARAAAAERDRDALLRGFESTYAEQLDGPAGDWTVYLATEHDGLGDRLHVGEYMHESDATADAARWQALIDTARSARSNAKEA